MPVERIEPLQQVVDLEVRVAIVARADLGALARTASRPRRTAASTWPSSAASKTVARLLLGLADPLRHDLREIDLVELEAELARDHAGDHGLAGAGRAREQRGDAEPRAPSCAPKPQSSNTRRRCRTRASSSTSASVDRRARPGRPTSASPRRACRSRRAGDRALRASRSRCAPDGRRQRFAPLQDGPSSRSMQALAGGRLRAAPRRLDSRAGSRVSTWLSDRRRSEPPARSSRPACATGVR